jgi:osmotically-inducible protein OsmY
MPARTVVETRVAAALEREPSINLHRYPIRLGFDAANRAFTLEGEVENIIAKKLACEIARRADGVERVNDRLSVAAAGLGDGAIRVSLTEALAAEPVYSNCRLYVEEKGMMSPVREPPEPEGLIGASIHDGSVELRGHVLSLSHRRLASVLAWWIPGVRDVRNEIAVTPPEDDNDDEIADALRLVLEKDPSVPHADQIGIRVADRAVTLTGAVGADAERHRAEFDAWYLPGVRAVDNRLIVRR